MEAVLTGLELFVLGAVSGLAVIPIVHYLVHFERKGTKLDRKEKALRFKSGVTYHYYSTGRQEDYGKPFVEHYIDPDTLKPISSGIRSKELAARYRKGRIEDPGHVLTTYGAFTKD